MLCPAQGAEGVLAVPWDISRETGGLGAIHPVRGEEGKGEERYPEGEGVESPMLGQLMR